MTDQPSRQGCPECGAAPGVRHRDKCFFLTGDPADLLIPVIHLPSGRKGTVEAPWADLMAVQWESGYTSLVDNEELRVLPDGRPSL